MCNLLLNHLENKGLFKSQWGFQHSKSTTTALIIPHLDTRRDVCAVFFDLKKDFNSVPHSSLLKKLKSLEVPVSIVYWIQSYLTGRWQQVILNGVCSEPTHVVSGIHQGSVLGLSPILFLIYINGIFRITLSSGYKVILYADDMLLYKPVSNPSDYCALQDDVSQVHLWVMNNHFALNSNKRSYFPGKEPNLLISPGTQLAASGGQL